MTKSIDPQLKKRSQTFLWLAAASALLALPTHLYLLSEHYALRFGDYSGNSLCDISDLFSCAATAASKYSEVFGIPMALLGLVTNLAFVGLLGWHFFVDDEKKAASRRNLLILAGMIAAASVVMGTISTILIARFCPFCILAYILSFLMFAFLWKGLPAEGASKGAKHLARAPGPKDFVPLAGLLAVALFAAVVTNDEVKKSYGFKDLGPIVQQYVQLWENTPPTQIEAVEPLVKGATSEKAVLTIVEFADYLCIHCKSAAPRLDAFVRAHPDVRLLYQAWPLDGECNTAITRSNGMSCLLARSVFCAEKVSGGGWAASKWVFENQDSFRTVASVQSAIPKIAAAANANPDQVLACTQTPEMKSLIEKQAALGNTLKLQGTPTLFVNGRKLEGGQLLPVLEEAYNRAKAKQK